MLKNIRFSNHEHQISLQCTLQKYLGKAEGSVFVTFRAKCKKMTSKTQKSRFKIPINGIKKWDFHFKGHCYGNFKKTENYTWQVNYTYIVITAAAKIIQLSYHGMNGVDSYLSCVSIQRAEAFLSCILSIASVITVAAAAVYAYSKKTKTREMVFPRK